MKTDISQLPFQMQSDEYDQRILCPVCNNDYVHLTGDTVLIDGKDDYKARPGQVRGGVILIPGFCENGCKFQIAFGFHKGNTLIWTEPLGFLKEGEHSKDMR